MQRLRTRLRSGASSGFAPPSLLLDFTSGAGFDSRVTFSRGSNATLVDSTGKITYAPANLVLRSDDFDNAGSWTKNATTVASNSTTAPDGTLTADTLTATATTAVHNVQQVSGGAGVTLVWSVYAKAGTNNFIQLWHGISTQTYANFNVSTGVVGTVGTDATASITDAGNGWYRCSIRFTTSALGTVRVALVTSATAAYNESWTAAGTENVFIWGAQLEPVTYQTAPSTYVATTTAAYYGPRFDYDPVTLAAKGLLIEEQRVNLVTYSEQFNNAAWSKSSVTVTADTTVAPDGTTTADTLTASTAAAFTWQVISFTGDGDKTMSCFVKAGTAATSVVQIRDATAVANRGYFIITWTAGVPSVAPLTTGTVLGVDAFGNGWYRLRLLATGVVAANSNQYRFLPDTTSGTGTVIAWGAQAENGSFATSYIPTVASQVTRSADVATMTGTNFSSWYNAAEGSFVMEATVPTNVDGALGNYYLAASDGTIANQILLAEVNGTTGQIQTSSVLEFSSKVGVEPTGIVKAALAYKTNDVILCVGGTLGTLDTSVALPTVNRLSIGIRGDNNASTPLNGHIRQIAYYNTRLSDATLQELTAPQMITTLSLDFINGIYDA